MDAATETRSPAAGDKRAARRARRSADAVATIARRDFPASDHDLTVVVPAHNEMGRLPATLAGLRRELDGWGIDYRVLVVDDGSTDGTAGLTAALDDRFETVSLSRCQGKGHAVRMGMLCATGRVLAFTDADLPFDLAAMREGYDAIHRGRAAVVFGARDLPGATTAACRRKSRRLATRIFRKGVARWFVSRNVTDTQCGLKLFSRAAALEIFSRATIDGFAFDVEVVLLAERLRLPYVRVPVRLVNDYDSSLSLARHTLPMMADVARLWLRSRFAPPANWRPNSFAFHFFDPAEPESEILQRRSA